MNFEGGFFLILGLVFIPPALYWLSRLVNGLRCDAGTFDALRVGQTVEARVLDLGRIFKALFGYIRRRRRKTRAKRL